MDSTDQPADQPADQPTDQPTNQETQLAGRQAASKERRRARILRAAADLLDQRGFGNITMDDVATAADVSRRTVFNYFPSVDDLVVAVGVDWLRDLIEQLRLASPAQSQVAPPPRQDLRQDSAAAVFWDLAQALRSTDLVAPIVRLSRSLGGVGTGDPRVAAAVQHAILRLTGQLADQSRLRHPEADRLTVDLVVAGLISGATVIYDHWARSTGAVDTPESRQTWAALVEFLIERTAAGPLAPSDRANTPVSGN
ncbi:MAG: TetR family transcriptional regulator [Bifidobacteriaceae bacterium]|nr:TetR family transcriptional regulator [Bifidobacteriaceae bacterium]